MVSTMNMSVLILLVSALLMSGCGKPTTVLDEAVAKRYGIKCRVDEAGSKQIFMAEAAKGNPLANMWLAFSYKWGGRGFDQSNLIAQALAREVIDDVMTAASNNNAMAQYLIGSAYEEGIGTESNLTKAVEYYRASAKQGYSCALISLGTCYEDGLGVKIDVRKAAENYKKAAELGNSIGMCCLGLFYECGKGFEKDPRRAVTWYRKAADFGSVDAIRRVSVCYNIGIGVEIDASKSFEWYGKAADLGDAESMFDLGDCYSKGIGVKQNERKAYELYQKAADLGYNDAIRSVAECYKEGLGVEQNENKAVEWYQKVVELGDVNPMRMFGNNYISLYENKPHDTTNLFLAAYWYLRAAQSGDAESMFLYSQIMKQCTNTQTRIDYLIKAYDAGCRWIDHDIQVIRIGNKLLAGVYKLFCLDRLQAQC